MTLRDGLDQLPGKLAQHLDKTRIYLGQRVSSIELAPGGPGGTVDSCSRRYQIFCEGGVAFDADAIIFAMPAHECSRLLSSLHPTLGSLLGEIPYSSSMTVSLGYAEGTREHLLPGFGYLVPRKENRRMLACTFVHRKFNYRAPEGKALLRCFLGGSRDPEVLNLPDQEVVSLVRQELKEILNFSFAPLFHRVHRWPVSMAQYQVGHAGRIKRIQSQLEDLPGIYLAGNAYSGIGISDCIRTGRAAARQALQSMNYE
jgi:oxygen-dependent protoporphyrinogen oxidase